MDSKVYIVRAPGCLYLTGVQKIKHFYFFLIWQNIFFALCIWLASFTKKHFKVFLVYWCNSFIIQSKKYNLCSIRSTFFPIIFPLFIMIYTAAFSKLLYYTYNVKIRFLETRAEQHKSFFLVMFFEVGDRPIV